MEITTKDFLEKSHFVPDTTTQTLLLVVCTASFTRNAIHTLNEIEDNCPTFYLQSRQVSIITFVS